MNYIVGSHIDLTYLNEGKVVERAPRTDYEQYIAGTKVTFWTVTRDFVLMSVKEPATPLTRFFA